MAISAFPFQDCSHVVGHGASLKNLSAGRNAANVAPWMYKRKRHARSDKELTAKAN
jgi:hypothetical protein